MKTIIQFFRRVYSFFTTPPRHKYKQGKAREVLDKVLSFKGEHREGRIMNYLRTIDPFVFEELLLTALERDGYRVERNKRYTGDGGVDGVVYFKDRKYLIQAKRYSGHITLDDADNFLRLVNDERANGFFIHTGRTGAAVKDKLRGSRVEVISGDKLIELISRAA